MADNPLRYVVATPNVSLTSPAFVGRGRELDLLDEMIDASGGGPSFVVGQWGVGKTALCHMYALSRKEKFSNVIHFSASGFGSPDAIVDHIQNRLSLHDSPLLADERRSLVIVDDLELLNEAEASYLLTLLHMNSPVYTSICVSRHRFEFLTYSEIPSLELQLPPFMNQC
jgi:hypothetical protein